MQTTFLSLLALAVGAGVSMGAAPEAKNTWEVRTSATVVRLAMRNGAPVVSEVRSPNGKWNYVSASLEAKLPESVYVSAAERKPKWSFAGASVKGARVAFRYTCAAPRMEAVSTWEGGAAAGPVEHSLAIVNKSPDVVSLAPRPATELLIAVPSGHALESWWVEKGSGNTTDVGTHVDAITPDTKQTLYSGTNGDSEFGRDAIPWFAVHDTTVDRGIYGGIEFSGWTEIRLHSAGPDTLAASMGTFEDGGKTRLMVAAGATCEMPACLVGVYEGSVDDGCNVLHRWVEEKLRPPVPGGQTPLLVNNSWGSGMEVDDQLARRMIDECADLGMEVYHVDAGWYKRVGDWYTDPVKFPKGLESVSDYARSKGLRFGLWTAWTQGGAIEDYRDDTLSPFSPQQRNWFGVDYQPGWRNRQFSGATVCLASRQARDWCLRDLRRIVSGYKVDLLEHDQNMISDHCIRDDHGHTAGDRADTSRVAANAYYSVHEQLLGEYPDLILEDCYNGGRIVDFGEARRVHYICATDTYHPLALRRAFYDTSYPLPPSMIEAYIGNHPGSTLANFKYMLRSGMMGWCTVMLDTSTWNAQQREAARRSFAVYKKKLRPLIASANLYHVLPRPTRQGWDGVQYFDPKSGNGALFVFRTGSPEGERKVRLRGLEPKKSYSLASEDGSVSARFATGKALMESGLTITLPETNSSDLVFIQERR